MHFYPYICCQCHNGPKLYSIEPRCRICNHAACANCPVPTAKGLRDLRQKVNSDASYINTANEIALILSRDDEIRALCEQALQDNEADDTRLTEFLRGLLTIYGEKLKETPGDINSLAGEFIQSFPESTALAIVRSLDPKDNGERGYLLERHSGGSSEKTDEYSESRLLTLQRMNYRDLQRALVVGTASEHLRHNLSLLVYPNKRLERANYYPNTELKRNIYMLRDLTNIPYRMKQTVDRWLRPEVNGDHMRAEWKCTCGYVMYRDLKTKEAEQRDQFLGQVAPCQAQHCEVSHITARSGSSSTASSNLNQAQRSGTDSSDGLTIPRYTANSMLQPARRNSSDSENPAVSPGSRQRSQAPYSKKQKFLELCVNTGKYTISLGEIAVGDVGTDGDLFSEIRKRYYELRPMHFRRLFYHPADIHYVCVRNPDTNIKELSDSSQFSLHRTYRVGIHRQPLDLPPEEESKNYEYTRCQFPPPMDPREFLHYFYGHDGSHPFQTYLSRLPKKVERSMYQEQSQDLVFGWGIHIIEGPNKALLLWIVCAILVLSGVVSVVYAVVMKSEEQGFGIGQWIVAVLSTALAALYYQWEHV